LHETRQHLCLNKTHFFENVPRKLEEGRIITDIVRYDDMCFMKYCMFILSTVADIVNKTSRN